MSTLISHSLGETKKFAEQWIDEITLLYKASNEALLVGLSGHLGSGKTAFVKLIAEILGAKEDVTSPTFVIMKIYNTPHPRWKRLVHIDAYRLDGKEQLEVLQLKKTLADPNSLIMIEWPENVDYKYFQVSACLNFKATEEVHIIEVK